MEVQRFQFLSALGQVENLDPLYQAIPADVSDPLWIYFNSANCIATNDLLASFVQSFYNLTDAQMAAIFKNAEQIGPGC